jgi:Fic family protein
MENYQPPFQISDKMINLVAEISESIGRIAVDSERVSNPRLRRENRIKTIQASLAIENNTLSIEQITAILNGKRVLGHPAEIREVENAYTAYERLLELEPLSISDLLKAHGMMMADLVKEAGIFRHGDVGITDGEVVVHMAPPARMVPELIRQLFDWYKKSTVHPLIRSCVFHYEFEFIHPFSDGNGRMGRMWHTLLLSRWKEMMAWVPVETLVKERQTEYYQVLGLADKNADSTVFIEFMLTAIRDTCGELIHSVPVTDQVPIRYRPGTDQVAELLEILGEKTMSAAELMAALGLSHRGSFRANYLNPALEAGLIKRTIPDKPSSSRQKYQRVIDPAAD